MGSGASANKHLAVIRDENRVDYRTALDTITRRVDTSPKGVTRRTNTLAKQHMKNFGTESDPVYFPSPEEIDAVVENWGAKPPRERNRGKKGKKTGPSTGVVEIPHRMKIEHGFSYEAYSTADAFDEYEDMFTTNRDPAIFVKAGTLATDKDGNITADSLIALQETLNQGSYYKHLIPAYCQALGIAESGLRQKINGLRGELLEHEIVAELGIGGTNTRLFVYADKQEGLLRVLQANDISAYDREPGDETNAGGIPDPADPPTPSPRKGRWTPAEGSSAYPVTLAGQTFEIADVRRQDYSFKVTVGGETSQQELGDAIRTQIESINPGLRDQGAIAYDRLGNDGCVTVSVMRDHKQDIGVMDAFNAVAGMLEKD